MIINTPTKISLNQIKHANIPASDKIENLNDYLEPYQLHLRGYRTAKQLYGELDHHKFADSLKKIKKYVNPKPLEKAHYFVTDISNNTIRKVTDNDVNDAFKQAVQLLKKSDK